MLSKATSSLLKSTLWNCCHCFAAVSEPGNSSCEDLNTLTVYWDDWHSILEMGPILETDFQLFFFSPCNFGQIMKSPNPGHSITGQTGGAIKLDGCWNGLYAAVPELSGSHQTILNSQLFWCWQWIKMEWKGLKKTVIMGI